MLSDAYVFDTTVADNLRVAAPEATDDDLRAALGRAGLENVDLSDRVGEDGAGLSGGQRQRLLLARALLGGPPGSALGRTDRALGQRGRRMR